MFDYDKEAKHAVEILDKYNLTEVLKKCHGKQLYDVAKALESYNQEIADIIFDLSAYELGIYLQERYYGNIREEIIPYFYWSNKGTKIEVKP